MKLIEAIIRAFSMDEVKTALQKIGIGEIGVEEIFVSLPQGRDQEKTLFYRGTEYVADFVGKMKVELIVEDDLADKVVGIISKIAGRDGKGDCRIYILPLIGAFY